MKTVGIIGGIGPESTIEYYRSIINLYREQKSDASYPSVIINSIDLHKMLSLIESNQLAMVTDYLVVEVDKLANAGADFGLLAAGTPHIVFNDINRQSSIPLLSIVEATCQAAKALGLKRIGLFGTRFTMEGNFYQEVFLQEQVALVVPKEEERRYIHDKYFSELVQGIFLPETRERLFTIVRRMRAQEGIDGLILGGTELSLIFRDATAIGIPLLDSTQIHVKATVSQLLT